MGAKKEEVPMWNAVPAHRHHDISDETWTLLEPHLPGREGVWGGIAKDNRLLINAVFWLLRTGAPWRELPPDHGGWSNTHRRFIRWRDKGIWEKRLEILIDEPDYEWLMIRRQPLQGPSPCRRSQRRKRGCAWSAGQNRYYRRSPGELHAGRPPD